MDQSFGRQRAIRTVMTALLWAPFAALGRPGQVEPFLPTGVAIVKSGDIYITSDIEHSVLRLSPH